MRTFGWHVICYAYIQREFDKGILSSDARRLWACVEPSEKGPIIERTSFVTKVWTIPVSRNKHFQRFVYFSMRLTDSNNSQKKRRFSDGLGDPTPPPLCPS